MSGRAKSLDSRLTLVAASKGRSALRAITNLPVVLTNVDFTSGRVDISQETICGRFMAASAGQGASGRVLRASGVPSAGLSFRFGRSRARSLYNRPRIGSAFAG